MPIKLTDEDRAAIIEIARSIRRDANERYSLGDYDRHALFYLAGMRAGMERAAKICEATPIDEASLFADRKWTTAALVRRLCAAAIRAY